MGQLLTDFLGPSSRAKINIFGFICLALLYLPACGRTPGPVKVIAVDGHGGGRTFDGLGAVSAGASTRLLMDYSEPYRSQVLDYLFKPGYGAALQHLKVEIGSDVDSTDGSEPSFARTRSEMDHPDFNRGYEWWLMEEAKRRNPNVFLDSLAWGAPGWIGQGHFYSQDMANYVAEFIEGARKAHGLDIQYTGIWNEVTHEPAYVKLLGETLLSHHLGTRIVCCDETPNENPWSIVDEMMKDPDLRSAVPVVSVHYPLEKAPQAAKDVSKPLWSSEDHPERPIWRDPHQDDWKRGRLLAKLYNLNYIEARFTKTEVWAIITSYYDLLAAPASGLMYANTPWSGNYRIQSPIWVTAHTTQFAQPGWTYIDSACGYLPGGGSYVALKSLSMGDYSVIMETVGAQATQGVTLRVSGGLSQGIVHVWETNATKAFEHVTDILPHDGSFTISLDPDSVYSLTTTAGQGKGTATPAPAAPFPFPYNENFEDTDLGRSPRYLADQDGAFEVQPCQGRPGRCLEQILTQKPIPWHGLPNPYTMLGSNDWGDYTVSAEVMLEEAGEAALLGRIDDPSVFKDWEEAWPNAYILLIRHDGRWELDSTKLKAPPLKLASGNVPSSIKNWRQLKLSFRGSGIEASIDGTLIAHLQDTSHSHGMAGVGTGWNRAQFDNFVVR